MYGTRVYALSLESLFPASSTSAFGGVFLALFPFRISCIWLYIRKSLVSFKFCNQRSMDAGASVRVPISQLPAIADAFRSQHVVTIYTALAIVILLVFSLGALYLWVTSSCGLTFAGKRQTSVSEHRPVIRER
jgi:hypothetical protein